MRGRLWMAMALAPVLALGGSLVVLAQGEAKSESKTPSRRAGTQLDLEYGFIVERNEKPVEMAALGELTSGERFQIRVKPKQAAYGYLFVTRDEKGYELVLPDEGEKARTAALARGEWQTLPDKDWLRFDKTRGRERLVLFLSLAKVEAIEELFADGRKVDVVDEAWLLDLRNKLAGDGATLHDRSGGVVRVTHRRRGDGPVVLVEEFTVRHK